MILILKIKCLKNSFVRSRFDEKLLEKDVDIDAPPIDNKMFITMKDVPIWDTELHYWEQKKETLVFYASEFQKIKNVPIF